jgi:ribosomal protein L37AE/L43A
MHKCTKCGEIAFFNVSVSRDRALGVWLCRRCYELFARWLVVAPLRESDYPQPGKK